ncbi:hypothetical protein ANTQUA_LOCUS6140 [Anthophora quadrimaculata]
MPTDDFKTCLQAHTFTTDYVLLKLLLELCRLFWIACKRLPVLRLANISKKGEPILQIIVKIETAIFQGLI